MTTTPVVVLVVRPNAAMRPQTRVQRRSLVVRAEVSFILRLLALRSGFDSRYRTGPIDITARARHSKIGGFENVRAASRGVFGIFFFPRWETSINLAIRVGQFAWRKAAKSEFCKDGNHGTASMRHFAVEMNYSASPRALFASVEKRYLKPRPFALPQIIIIDAVISDQYGIIANTCMQPCRLVHVECPGSHSMQYHQFIHTNPSESM